MKGFQYNSAFINSNVEKTFSVVCNKELAQFNEIYEIMEEINDYLESKNDELNSLEYYIALINRRITDHMISATLLIGKGFIIDGLNLVRSSYEDLWLVQNMFFKEGYFEEWLNGQEVRPWRLRQLKEIEEIKEENEIIYKALCNISHCSLASVNHMRSINLSINPVVNDYRLVVISYYSFAVQLGEALETYYGKDDRNSKINNTLLNLDIVKFGEE